MSFKTQKIPFWQDNTLCASKAKINVFWNFFEWSGPEGGLQFFFRIRLCLHNQILIRSGNQCSKGIGYYTQLVWQDTTHVGCGWSQFQYRGFPGYYENFLVCNYGPAANVWKQPVYDIGECSVCISGWRKGRVPAALCVIFLILILVSLHYVYYSGSCDYLKG